MKKIFFTLLNILAFASLGQAQCAFENIFPVKHGFSKFKATTTIASIKSIKDRRYNEYSRIGSWEKFDYLKGDSVLKCSTSYDYLYHDCFKGDENVLYLFFVDDKLYKIDVYLTFSNTEFEKCMENYNELVAIFKNNFIGWDNFVRNSNETNEQVGEGYWFYPTTKNKRSKVKVEYLSIGYTVKYEMKWSEDKKEWYQSGNIDKYEIEISYVNLKRTKLTNEGY